MGVNDAREQLEVAKAEVVRLEHEVADLLGGVERLTNEREQLARLHEVATDRTVQFAAVIEQAKAVWHDPDNHAFGVKAHRILESADTSAVLRERDAAKWDEGYAAGVLNTAYDVNPYRSTEGGTRG